MAKMPRRRFARTMYLKQVLVNFDGPQVVLMQSDRGYPAVGVAVEDNDLTEDHIIHFSEISEDALRRYLSERVDLRYLFVSAAKHRYLGAWSNLDEQGWLRVGRADDIHDAGWFPERGFWARFHTEDVKAAGPVADTLAKFAIDGTWDANDFSRFYGRMADLYAFLSIASATSLQNLSEGFIGMVKSAIRNRAWRGGGSYVGFYDAIFSDVFALSPLRVRGIQYNSPGTIDLKGAEGPLSDISRVVDNFGADDGSVRDAARTVDQLLARALLKRAPIGSRFQTADAAFVAKAKCDELLRALGIDDPDVVFDLCDGDVVTYSKLSLSFFRRARDLYNFHAEGRVSAAGLHSSGSPLFK